MSRSRDMTGSKAPLIASGYQQGARATAMLQGGSSPFDFCMCTGTKLEEFFAPNLKKHSSTQNRRTTSTCNELRCLAPLLRVC